MGARERGTPAHRGRATSHHAKLLAVETAIEGNHLYLDCAYATGEAAGQNMVTFATAALCAELIAGAPVLPRSYAVESNASGDKKATAHALTSTRGRRVCAEVTIPAALLEARLRVTPEMLAAYWRLGAVAATMTGTIGMQGMYANALAAFYLATGQDIACVAESAVGITRLDVAPDGALYACVTMPNVVVATVGGGTGLPTQRAAARLLARDGVPPTADALAEIVAAVTLAGEISLTGRCARTSSRPRISASRAATPELRHEPLARVRARALPARTERRADRGVQRLGDRVLRAGARRRPLPAWYLVAAGFASSFLMFALLRIADEFKDAGDDARWRPYRPVPRGLVTLRQLAVAGAICMGCSSRSRWR